MIMWDGHGHVLRDSVTLPGPASAESLLVRGGLLQAEYSALCLMLAHILKENNT